MRAIEGRGLGQCGVVMTAASDARHWAREIRAHGVLAKPFELGELLDALQCFRGGLGCPEPESRLA